MRLAAEVPINQPNRTRARYSSGEGRLTVWAEVG